MNEQKAFDRAVHHIYEAAGDPGRWDDALTEVGGLIGGDLCHMIGWDAQAEGDILGARSPSTADFSIERYNSGYGAIDPRRRLAAEHLVGQVLLCGDHFDANFVARSRFYQEFLIPSGFRHTLWGSLWRGAGLDIQISLMRTTANGTFSAAHGGTLARLIGHLQRAMSVSMQIRSQAQRESIGLAALEYSNLGVFGLTRTGEILYANRRGEAFLRTKTWLQCVRNTLHAANTSRDNALQAVLKSAGQTRRTANVSVGHAETADHCCLSLVPLSNNSPFLHTDLRVDILCLVTEVSTQRTVTAQQLMELFELSPAQARLARCLAQGESLEQCAENLGVELSTLKTQLRGIFAKTGTNRQSDLIRVLVSLPSVRHTATPQVRATDTPYAI